MPPPSTPFVDKQITALLECGTEMRTIPKLVEPPVSYRKVLKVKRSLLQLNSARPPRLIVQSRKPKITNEIGAALENLLLDRPSTYVDEMECLVWDEFHVEVSQGTIRRWMRKKIKKYTRKLLLKPEREHSQALRDHWMVRVQQ
jgi:hypothetical protein